MTPIEDPNILAMLEREATMLGREVTLDDARGISTQHGRIWLLVYDASSETQEQLRWAVYQQVGEELTPFTSGILHVATKRAES